MKTRNIDLMLSVVAFAALLALLGSACSAVLPSTGAPLPGTRWNLTSYNGTSTLPGTNVTLSFENDQLGGNAGCNSYGGSYQAEEGKIAIGELVQTEMACMNPAGVMEQESTYLQLLGSAETYQMSAEGLQITTAGGGTLMFTPQE